MNPIVKAKWLQALRSGEYQQTIEVLQRTEPGDDDGDYPAGFCCLGVLCDLAVKAGVLPAPEFTEHGIALYLDYTNDGQPTPEDAGLPKSVQKWAGLREQVPNVRYRPDYDTGLADLNDVQKLSFTQIADLIEDQL